MCGDLQRTTSVRLVKIYGFLMQESRDLDAYSPHTPRLEMPGFRVALVSAGIAIYLIAHEKKMMIGKRDHVT